MHEPRTIHRVAILGAGVMGAQIAAHCVNAGFETYLFDLADNECHPNTLVNQAIAKLNQLKPSPVAGKHTSDLIKPANYETDLEKLKECDFVLEAIAERLELKKTLYERIKPYLPETAILATNTSGLSIRELAKILPESVKNRFCGVHFFNPPRYMHLAELIPSKDCSAALVDGLETWLTRYLGKGVVRAKDTPNFIANRIGVFSLLSIIHNAQIYGLKLDEVDALTGQRIGRPKSATYRTMDIVGLDTLAHVVATMRTQLEDDPWHALFILPDWLMKCIDQGYLGQKAGQGIYRKVHGKIEVYDVETDTYRQANSQIDVEVEEALAITDLKNRFQQLQSIKHPQAQFLVACLRDLFHYCAYHVANIAETTRDVDLAMRWGFGWDVGPFETWQAMGVVSIKQMIEQAINDKQTVADAKLPGWLDELDLFINANGAFNPTIQTYQQRSTLPVYKRQYVPETLLGESIYKKKVWYENEGVCLWGLQNDIGVVSFKSKANSINYAVLDGLNEALGIVEQTGQGMIIYQDCPDNFSVGADLRAVAGFIQEKNFSALEAMVDDFQSVLTRLKYSFIPVVAALRGRALGGGCELIMHCDQIVSGFEVYPGLVELGAGLIPAGGGCKVLANDVANQAGSGDFMPFLQLCFDKVATGFVASSAPEALERRYLRDTDKWVMHRQEVLYAAVSAIQTMQAMNYLPPLPQPFRVAGRSGYARLRVGLANWHAGRFISDYDYFLASKLAFVLCGGDVNEGTLVDDKWMMMLEKSVFVELAHHEKTQERIRHLLETGKPLRN